jgi:lysophospholipase L1-like esterase
MMNTRQTKPSAMKTILAATILAFFLAGACKAIAQQPFEKEIAAFKKQDSLSFPHKNAILFVGSSSFRMWTDVQSDFPGYTIINRGFGGSTLPDVIRYTNDIIIPYQPKQVVIYCGDNDLASSDTVTATMVANRFQQLFYSIRKALPKTRISYVSIKPSPSRMHLMNKMKLANALIKSFLRKQRNTSYIDVFTPMLAADGQPRQDIFLKDNLHMNKQGYRIWQKTIQPYLLK